MGHSKEKLDISTCSPSTVGHEDSELGTQETVESPVNDTDSIPNGGTKAWIQVIGSFFIFFNTW